MSICISLFGRLSIRREGGETICLDSLRAQELLCLLLLQRRPQTRDALASLLWPDQPISRSRQYLRKALWQLQAGLQAMGRPAPCLQSGQDMVSLDCGACVSVDAWRFETAVLAARDQPGRELSASQAEGLRSALDLYRDELLSGWCQDWCLVERERFELMFFTAVDKLIMFCEAHREFEAGIAYGQAALAHDRAREHTHRALMRLYYLSGDRTAALRQFQRCVAALQEELDVGPAAQTLALLERIRGDRPAALPGRELALDWREPPATEGGIASMEKLLDGLQQLQTTLRGVERRLGRHIEALKAGRRR